jgi:PRC-barrel domain
MTVRILGVVGLIAFIAFAPAHAQRRDSLKDARDDVEATKKLPGKKVAESPPSNPERGGSFEPPTSSPISQLPSDALPVASHLSKADVYDSSNAKVGLIEDVLVGQDGKVVAYILNVGEWYGGLGKYIAVPFQAMEIKKKDDSAWAVLFMTKDAVQSAPQQKFDQSQRKWVPYQPR